MRIENVSQNELRPFDMLGEGRVIQSIHWYGGRTILHVADAQVTRHNDGLKTITWSDWHEEDFPTEPVRVIRGWVDSKLDRTDP